MGNTQSLRGKPKAKSSEQSPKQQQTDSAAPVPDLANCRKAGSLPPCDSDTPPSGPVTSEDASELHCILGNVSAQVAQQGLPWPYLACGAPHPACDNKRFDALDALNSVNPLMDVQLLETPQDPEIESILKLICSLYNAPFALINICHKDTVFIRDTVGGFPRGPLQREHGFCPWGTCAAHDETMILPDTQLDARLASNKFVAGPPGIRFYCGAPLIASNGHRLGNLCFFDLKPREMDAGSCMILNNLAEVCVRHLEKDIAMHLGERKNQQLEQAYAKLQRTLDCVDHCLVLLDTSVPGWQMLYMNEAWNKVTGTEREQMVRLSVHDVLAQADGGELVRPEHAELAAANKEIIITGVVVRGQPGGRKLKLTFRPATKDKVDQFSIPIGVPAFVAAEPQKDSLMQPRRFYFMAVDEMPPEPAPQVYLPSMISMHPSEDVIEGLEIEHLLGRGSFGRVYFGRYFGCPVAVKMIERGTHTVQTSRGVLPLEAVLGTQLAHPNVVVTMRHFTRHSTHKTRTITDSATSPTLGGGIPGNGAAAGPGKLLAAAPAATECHGAATTAVAATAASAVVSSASTACVTGSCATGSSDCATASSAAATADGPHMSTWTNTDSSLSTSQHNRDIGGPVDAQTPALLAESAPVYYSACEQPAVDLSPSHPLHSSDNDRIAKTSQGLIRDDKGADTTAGMQPFGGHAWATFNLTDMQHATHKSQAASHSAAAATCSSFNGASRASQCMMGLMAAGQAEEQPQLEDETWLLLEFCDRGCLQDAIERGWLRTAPSLKHGPNLPAILATASEIASALAFLHSRGIIHGDLSAYNVLLSSTGSQAAAGNRNFVAKVGDFGLSRALEISSCIDTHTYGTLTHMPPELLSDCILSKATDVYSFGVLLWQMYTGSRPWVGLTHGQIIHTLVSNSSRLQFTPESWQPYVDLAMQCMAYNAQERPAFEQIQAKVLELQQLVDEGEHVSGTHG